jgi:hypothetical protein
MVETSVLLLGIGMEERGSIKWYEQPTKQTLDEVDIGRKSAEMLDNDQSFPTR